VDLPAQRREAGVACRDLERELPHARGGARVGLQRQQAHRLAQQQQALRRQPARIGEQREHQAPRAGLLVFGLERTPVAARAAEDPAVVRRDQEPLEQDLREHLTLRARAREGARIELAEQVRDLVAVLAQRKRVRVPAAVLDPSAMGRAGPGPGLQHGPVAAEPAHGVEGALGRALELLDPGARRLGREAIGGPAVSRARESCRDQQGGEETMRSRHGQAA
jgi:hypothetical protein